MDESDYHKEVKTVVSAVEELTQDVRVVVVKDNEYEVFARGEMLYMNPDKQVYGIRDESKQDSFLFCEDFADAIGKFTSKLLNKN